MSRRLRSGAIRVFGRHDGARGRAFDMQYRALESRYGRFDVFTRQYASSVAALFVEWRAASESLADAQRQRRDGKGRRPNQAAIARLQKRAGLAWESYDRALIRLQELSAKQTSLTDPLEDLLRVDA